MPEGHWSPLRPSWERAHGRDGFGRKAQIPAWPCAKSQLCRAGLDLSLNNDPSPEPLKGSHFYHGRLLSASQRGPPSPHECVAFQSAIISFHTVYFGQSSDRGTSVRLSHLLESAIPTRSTAELFIRCRHTTVLDCLSRRGSCTQSPPSVPVCLLSVSV